MANAIKLRHVLGVSLAHSSMSMSPAEVVMRTRPDVGSDIDDGKRQAAVADPGGRSE